MRVTVSSARSLRLAKETNKKISVTAGAVKGALAERPYLFPRLVRAGEHVGQVTGC